MEEYRDGNIAANKDAIDSHVAFGKEHKKAKEWYEAGKDMGAVFSLVYQDMSDLSGYTCVE